MLHALGFSSVAAFAKKAGLPQQTVNSQLKRGRLSAETISAISVAGGSADWLLTGEGPMLRSSAAEEDSADHWQRQAEHWKTYALKMEGERDAYRAMANALGRTPGDREGPGLLNEPAEGLSQEELRLVDAYRAAPVDVRDAAWGTLNRGALVDERGPEQEREAGGATRRGSKRRGE